VPTPTTKQHVIVRIQPNIVTSPTYPEKFIRDNVTFRCDCHLPLECKAGENLVHASNGNARRGALFGYSRALEMTDPITFGYSLQTITFDLGNRLLVTDY